MSMDTMERITGVQDIPQGVQDTFIPFKPAGTWLVVEMEAARDKTSSGILYVPDTAKDAPQVGHVVAVGPGTKINSIQASDIPFFDPCDTKVGARILFQKYAGAEIEWNDGKTYLFVKESDVVSYIVDNSHA